ncbi:MAG: hypothetical protein ACTHOU_09395 [Aureliella sp.]
MNPMLDPFARESLDAAAAQRLAGSFGCRDQAAAAENLQKLFQLGIAQELLVICIEQLLKILPTAPDPDRGLANLVRYIEASRSPQALLALFERDELALPTLMRILAASQSWAEQLIIDPESFDLLRLTEGLPVSRGILVDELANEISSSVDPQQVSRSLRTHRQRETMRIAFGDFIGALALETVTQQLSVLAEAILETAVTVARREALARFGLPLNAEGQPARFAVIGYGKLGGNESSYAPAIDVLFVADAVDAFQGRRGVAIHDYFERVAKRVMQLVCDGAQQPGHYVLTMDLRPDGQRGPLCAVADTAVRYYENQGQTWQRQAFIKARQVAGDMSLGSEFLAQLQPWIYRRYLSRADITEIVALKRRLEKRVAEGESPQPSVNDHPGGVRDIEFLIQYLQLLNGGELPEVRTGNTLDAIAALERTGCLTAQERSVLEDNYRFLRHLEHRLQIVFGETAQSLPETEVDLRQFLLASGFEAAQGQPDVAGLAKQLSERTQRNSRILNHLLSETFSSESGEVAPETDLVLELAPTPQRVESLLAKYGFSDRQAAFRQLSALGQEQVSFLSSRRCRHFLSAIAPRLLASLSETPSPDQTLANLERVSSSLGGKAVLWELFQANLAAMNLCVRLCASSPYLVGILTSNPGMIDELIDSLMLDRLPGTQHIDALLSDLCRGVDEPGIVLHSFKNSMHLHIGVRDVLGKDEIVDTHRALSDVAEACLKQVVEHEYHRLIQKLGVPTIAAGARAGETAELVVLAVGKLGGREPNYHSDLDVLFLFEGEGSTRGLLPQRRHDSISNRQFFNQLAQRVVKSITRVGPAGRLYDLAAGLRPLGGGVGTAESIDDLQNYFCQGPAQLWERQALCKARPVWASPAILPRVTESVRGMLTALEWKPEFAADIQRHRLRLEQGAASTNIKRGSGGTLDVEFVVQMLQLRYARGEPSILVPGTLDALAQLEKAGLLEPAQAQRLGANYRWLRRVESGLRLMNLPARHDLPSAADQLDQLQFLLQGSHERAAAAAAEPETPDEPAPGQAGGQRHPLARTCMRVLDENRRITQAIFAAAGR